MPVVGLEPISKNDIFGICSDIFGICSDIFGFSYPFIFLRSPLKRIHHATRNATRKKYKIFLYFRSWLTIFLYSPNSVPNAPKIIPNFRDWFPRYSHFGQYEKWIALLNAEKLNSFSQIHGYSQKWEMNQTFIVSKWLLDPPDRSDALGHFRTFSEKCSQNKCFCSQNTCFCFQNALCCQHYSPAAFSQQITQLLRNSDTLTSAGCQILSIFDEFCRFMLKYVSIC